MSDIQNNTDLSAELVRDLIKERRCDRRWRNLRFFAGFLVIATIIVLGVTGGPGCLVALGSSNNDSSAYVALVHLDGMIAPDKDFSALQVLPLLRDAFSDSQAKGVVLDINSGGGTPVQASIIHDEVLKLKRKYHKKVVVVGEDMLASGAYFVAVSADKIYVNPNTVTGSIGVIMQGFGLQDVMKRIGVERRVYTAGGNKDRLDPFKPENPVDVAKIKAVIDEVHKSFIQAVMNGRKGKLVGDENELFSGDFWSGEGALKLGLVDGLGNLSDVLEKEFDVAHYRDYSLSNNLLKSLASQLGASLSLPLGAETQSHLLEKL
jgi:protease-4